MSDPRICPECGSDIWAASHFTEVSEARNRHYQENKRQALEILALRLKVAELEEWRRNRNRKIEMQRRTIRRLEKRLRELKVRPHEDKPLGEGPPASPTPEVSPDVPEEPGYPSPRGMRELRRQRERATERRDS